MDLSSERLPQKRKVRQSKRTGTGPDSVARSNPVLFGDARAVPTRGRYRSREIDDSFSQTEGWLREIGASSSRVRLFVIPDNAALTYGGRVGVGCRVKVSHQRLLRLGRLHPVSKRDMLRVMDPKQIVQSDPDIVSGTPVFVGTRVPVQALLDYLEGGETIDEFLDDFPSVSREQAIAFLEEAGRAFLARIA